MKKTKTSSNRIHWIDSLRGLAIVLMIIFHFCYDLRYFGWVDWRVPNGDGWWQFRYVILTLFIFTVGISLQLAHGQRSGNGFKAKPFWWRCGQLFVAAAAVTAMSLFMFPKSWIYFGILHFIFTASLVGIVFVRFLPNPLLPLAAGLLILFGYHSGVLTSAMPYSLFETWLPGHTEDFVPVFPWLGVCLLGVAAAGFLPLARIDRKIDKIKVLNWMGKHGLVIYLIHQPILFAILTPVSML